LGDRGERLEIGQTARYAFETIGAKIIPFALLVIGVGALNALIDSSGNTRASYSISSILTFFVSVGVTYLALKSRCGEGVPIKLAFGRALILNFLSSLGILLGMVLLVLPGLYLLACWAVAMPALMAEDLSASEALSRSKALSEGQRWALLGLMLLIWMPLMVFGLGWGMLGVTFFGEGIELSFGYNLILELVTAAGSTFVWVLESEAYISLSGQRTRLGALQDIFA
jgi:hypothetical protein